MGIVAAIKCSMSALKFFKGLQNWNDQTKDVEKTFDNSEKLAVTSLQFEKSFKSLQMNWLAETQTTMDGGMLECLQTKNTYSRSTEGLQSEED